MTAPRKRGGAKAKQRRLQIRKALSGTRPQRSNDHAGRRDQDRDHLEPGQMIAEEHETEDRGLDRFGLEISRRHHERTVVHGEQHHAGAGDLGERAEQQPRPELGRRPWHVIAGHGDHGRKEHNRERKPEQEADIGRAPGTERPRQRPLHRIARDLAERSDDGEGNPERGDAEHVGIR